MLAVAAGCQRFEGAVVENIEAARRPVDHPDHQGANRLLPVAIDPRLPDGDAAERLSAGRGQHSLLDRRLAQRLADGGSHPPHHLYLPRPVQTDEVAVAGQMKFGQHVLHLGVAAGSDASDFRCVVRQSDIPQFGHAAQDMHLDVRRIGQGRFQIDDGDAQIPLRALLAVEQIRLLQLDGAHPAEDRGDPVSRADPLVDVERGGRGILAQVLGAAPEQNFVEPPEQVHRVGSERLGVPLVDAAPLLHLLLLLLEDRDEKAGDDGGDQTGCRTDHGDQHVLGHELPLLFIPSVAGLAQRPRRAPIGVIIANSGQNGAPVVRSSGTDPAEQALTRSLQQNIKSAFRGWGPVADTGPWCFWPVLVSASGVGEAQMASAVMGTYDRFDIAFERGEGAWLYATDGRRFLDFGGGVAVTVLGHCHPHLVEALTGQARRLWHCSNLYRIPGQERLAERLVQLSFADAAFFCNSGAEAIECGLKLTRKYQQTVVGRASATG